MVVVRGISRERIVWSKILKSARHALAPSPRFGKAASELMTLELDL